MCSLCKRVSTVYNEDAFNLIRVFWLLVFCNKIRKECVKEVKTTAVFTIAGKWMTRWLTIEGEAGLFCPETPSFVSTFFSSSSKNTWLLLSCPKGKTSGFYYQLKLDNPLGGNVVVRNYFTCTMYRLNGSIADGKFPWLIQNKWQDCRVPVARIFQLSKSWLNNCLHQSWRFPLLKSAL